MTDIQHKEQKPKFDYNGEWYSMVEQIDSLTDLVEAINIRDIMRICVETREPELGHPAFYLLKEQESLIQEYMQRFGNFDKSILMSNIHYLLKENDLRIGQLEQILEISAGYLSRAGNPKSDKKISIDIVWKIARIFGVSLQDLIEKDLRAPSANLNLVGRFLDRLRKQTDSAEIKWDNRGGAGKPVDTAFAKTGMFFGGDGGDVVTYDVTDHMNAGLEYFLSDNIYSCSSVADDAELAVIPFSTYGDDKVYLDFIFLDKNSTHGEWEKAFYMSDDREDVIRDKAEALFDSVKRQETDNQFSLQAKRRILAYMEKLSDISK